MEKRINALICLLLALFKNKFSAGILRANHSFSHSWRIHLFKKKSDDFVRKYQYFTLYYECVCMSIISSIISFQ